VVTKIYVFSGLPHGFSGIRSLPSSKRWDELMVESISWALQDQHPVLGSEVPIIVEIPVEKETLRTKPCHVLMTIEIELF
jgi:hypothetical protein